MELELTPNNDGMSVTITLEQLSKELGEQGILNDEISDPEFFYLSALALETREDSRYDINQCVMEFLRNSSAIDADMETCDEIENLLQ